MVTGKLNDWELSRIDTAIGRAEKDRAPVAFDARTARLLYDRAISLDTGGFDELKGEIEEKDREIDELQKQVDRLEEKLDDIHEKARV